MNFLSWWLSGAWEQSADWWACKRTRGCQQGQPLVHYSGGQSFTPSWITSGFFSFFPSLRELAKKSGHMEQSQQAGLFPFMFFCPLEAKAVPLLMAWVVPCARPFCPALPAPLVLMWCRIDSSAHFPGENLVFFSCGNEPWPLALCPPRLFLNGFSSLRRALQLCPVAGDLD